MLSLIHFVPLLVFKVGTLTPKLARTGSYCWYPGLVLSIKVIVELKSLTVGVITLEAVNAVGVAHEKKKSVPDAGWGCWSDQNV